MQGLCAALFVAVTAAAEPATVLVVDWSAADGGDTEIAAVRREYVEAVNARDADRVSTLYMSDARAIFSEGGLLRGAVELERRLEAGFAAVASATTITLTPTRFAISGDVGSETGTFNETMRAGGREATVEGVYVAIYSRGVDGRWRIAMEVRTTGPHPAIGLW
jgi:uncharacterized protein (TIGR02246 family)